MNYPLSLSFKLMALSPQLSIRDAGGNLVFYVKQKAFKLKEDISVFADEQQQQLYCTIKANRIVDISASYTFADPDGQAFGSVRRKGMKSIWRASYDILEADDTVMTITEENPWAKVGDALLAEIPIVGLITCYLFNPSYLVTSLDGAALLRCKKQPAFFEGKFQIDRLAEMDEVDETRALLALIMMLLLERHRG